MTYKLLKILCWTDIYMMISNTKNSVKIRMWAFLSRGLSSGEMFVFSGEIKMQFWRQVLDVVTLCFWCPLCISDFRRNRCTRNAEMLGIIGKFSSALNPCGSKVFSFIIQKSSRFFSLCFNSYLSMLVSFNCSINVNFECLLELWPGNRNCWSAWSKFRLFTSFRWLLSLKLKAVKFLVL